MLRWTRRCLTLVALLAALLSSRSAQAYPWMVRHGYFGCATCHSDPSGAGLLTRYGRAQADLLLRMRYGGAPVTSSEPASGGSTDSFDDFGSFDSFDEGDDGASNPASANETASKPAPPPISQPITEPLWGLIAPPDWLLLGGSYRHAILIAVGNPVRTFPMQADLYGQVKVGMFRAAGSLGMAKVPAGSPYARRAQLTRDQGNGLNLISRTYWVGADFGAFTLRAGRLELPFGIRIPEHTMWVRAETRTDRESAQQHGLALAYADQYLRGEVMAILGNYQLHPDSFRERGYSAYAEARLSESVFLGASSLVTHAQADFQSLETNVTRQAHGLFARIIPWSPMIVLAEADALLRSQHDLGYVGFTQLDYELVQGLHLAVTGEVLDAGYRNTGDPYNTAPLAPGFGRPRFGGWFTVDWFFLPQLEARFDAIARQKAPLTFLAQLHVFL